MKKGSENAGSASRELMDAMIETGGLLPSAVGARVRLCARNLSVTDGPFSEAKELIGAYAVFDVTPKVRRQ